MIEIRITELLAEKERSFYWLAKQTGISHTTLALEEGQSPGNHFRNPGGDLRSAGM